MSAVAVLVAGERFDTLDKSDEKHSQARECVADSAQVAILSDSGSRPTMAVAMNQPHSRRLRILVGTLFAVLPVFFLHMWAWTEAKALRRQLAELPASRRFEASPYRQVTGRLPHALDDLVPGYLQSLPGDPFTGSPLRFRVSDDQYVVYSVGENRRDDGGNLVTLGERYDAARKKGNDVGIRVVVRR